MQGIFRAKSKYHDNMSMEFWASASNAITEAIEHGNTPPSIVFFTMLNEYLQNTTSVEKLDRVFPYKWSGLVIRSEWLLGSPGEIPNPLSSKNFRSLFLLDECLVETAAAVTGRPAFRFPEFTDLELPGINEEVPLANELRKFKGDRKLIGLYGITDQRKGIFKVLTLAQKLAREPIAFAVIGDVATERQLPELRQFHHQLKSMNLGNVFYRRQFIHHEQHLNQIIKETDLLWLAYLDYPFSSNQLTKAAAFETPSVVNIGGLLAYRVEKYGLGAIVPIANIDRTAEQIVSYLNSSDGVNSKLAKEYLELNLKSVLHRSLQNLL